MLMLSLLSFFFHNTWKMLFSWVKSQAGNQASLQPQLVSPGKWERSRTAKGILQKFCLQIARTKSSPGPVKPGVWKNNSRSQNFVSAFKHLNKRSNLVSCWVTNVLFWISWEHSTRCLSVAKDHKLRQSFCKKFVQNLWLLSGSRPLCDVYS